VVRFTNLSSGNITSYTWDFGDGGSSPAANPVHTFTQPGTYTVKLTVTGPGGTANVSRQINVTSPSAPVASFTVDKASGEAPLTVQFTDTSTGQISSRQWNFGDGSVIDTSQNPTHTFNNKGTYNVILTVSGPGGNSTFIRQITVEDPAIAAPVAAFTANPTSGETPLTVQFTNQSTGQINQYLWDFNGDGLTDSTDESPVYEYTSAGTYEAKLTVLGDGGQDNATTTITVTNPPQAPVASFSASPTSGDIPLTVQFTNTTVGDVTSYAWDFNGDGTIDSAEQNPSHTYTSPGTYTVTLTATGPGGSTDATATITATEPMAAPVAAFIANPTSGQAPLTVTFTNQSSGEQLSYAWDFDGNGVTDSTEASPTFEYTTQGTYTVTLTVTNPVGTDSAQETIQVSEVVVIAPPVAAFTTNPPDPVSGEAPLTVQFTDASLGDGLSYEWDFDGDGTVDSTEQNPTHVYNVPGTYTAQLTVTNVGGSNSVQQLITVTAPPVPPTANFSANPTTGQAPLAVQFTDASTGDAPLSYAWDFDGDGVTDSTDQNPLFTFNNPGDYTVTLTVSNAAGSSSANAIISVSAAPVPPTANFSANPTTGQAPLAVQFTDASTGDAPLSYAWDFDGDGVTDSTDQNPLFTYNNPGDYTVTLTVSNAAGSSSANAVISVSAAPATPPDGDISFTSERAGNGDVFFMMQDGSGITNVTNNA
ncbi:MAG: PKD domain-containing protein, partial [Chloroflexi bacterium]